MSNRLPQIFLNNSAIFQSPLVKKKQGGIFQLDLKDKQFDQLNSTFTAGFKEKHFKTSIYKKVVRDTESNYRTLPLKVNQYEVPKQKRLLTGHLSLFRSSKVKSFSLDKNPQTCQNFYSCEQQSNVNSIIANRKHQLVDLGFQMAPLNFLVEDYRRDLQTIQKKIETQVHQIQREFKQAMHLMRGNISALRKQTGNEQKKNKIDLHKYGGDIKIFQQMAQDFPQKIESIKKAL